MPKPKYTLVYFNCRALGDPIRMIFHHANVEYEYKKVDDGEWEAFCKTTPFGKLPLLTIDGTDYGESSAVARYLGEKYGLGGKTEEDKLFMASMVDAMKDTASKFVSAAYPPMSEEDRKAYFAAKKKELPMPFYFIEKQLGKCTNGFLTQAGLTWADMFMFTFYNTLIHFMGKDFLDSVPNMKRHYQTVAAHPSIVKHMELTKDMVTYPF